MSTERNPIGSGRTILPIESNGVTEFRTIGKGAKCWTPSETPAPSGTGKGGGTTSHYVAPIGAYFTTEELLLILDIDTLFLASIADWPRSEIKQVAEKFTHNRTLSANQLLAMAIKIRAVAKKYGITLPTGFESAVY